MISGILLSVAWLLSVNGSNLKVFNPNQQGVEVWQYLNFANGAIQGFYAPFTQRVRNYDCFSETYNLGYELMNWYDAFRHNFFKDLSGVVYAIVAAVHIFGGIRWWSVCSSEMNNGLSNPFTKLLGSVSSVNYRHKNRLWPNAWHRLRAFDRFWGFLSIQSIRERRNMDL